MFGPFASQHSKTRRLAADWLELAEKVFHYRRDILPAADLATLTGAAGELRQLLRDKADIARLKLGIDTLEGALRRAGGSHYPKSGLVENIEFFLVAAIVILGLRSFYVQPFKIPTNSMWPSYNGMTAEVFATPAEEPGAAARLARFTMQLASARRINAPESGEIMLPLDARGVAFTLVKSRKWLVLPTVLREYRIVVGGRAAEPFRVPSDFDAETMFRDAFFPGDSRKLSEIINAKYLAGELATAKITTADGEKQVFFLRTGKTVKAGERALSFDVLTGDQLFVDRVSYHFVRPSVGDGFVFRTDHLTRLHEIMPQSPKEQYYIKRLVGLPGDTLRIKGHTLYRNGVPITGSPAFDKNAKQVERYVGYRDEDSFRGGAEVKIPKDHYMPLGDNSANSLDGRYWGPVGIKDVVGRPLFIYYPFTKRWGPAP